MRRSTFWKGTISVVVVLAAGVAAFYLGPHQSRSPVVSGELLYQRHCVPCHGREGRGDGPLAGSLEPKPADLTRLRAELGGSYSLDQLTQVIDGRRTIRAAHSTSQMPVWGEVFESSLKESPYASEMTLLQIHDLAEYLDTLQSATR